MYFKIIFLLQTLSPFAYSETTNQKNPSHRTGPQNSSVTQYDCEENELKTLHKCGIKRVTQCKSKPQEIETKNLLATLHSETRVTTLTRYKFTATLSEKKNIVLKSQMETKIDLITNLSIKVI